MSWVERNFDHFTPFDEDVYLPSRTKPFIELAIMFAVYVAATDDRASPAVRRAGQLLQTASKRADYIDWALRFPAELVNYAELCAAIHELGGDAGELRDRLQLAVDIGVPSQIERLPHRLLELRAALEWAGVKHGLPPTDEICAQTILGGPFSAYLLSESSIYAVTHVIIFASRFGLHACELPEWLQGPRLRRLLCDLMVVASRAQNWDLLGELLLCWDCLDLEYDLVAEAGWATFREAFRADGAVVPRPPKAVARETESFGGPTADVDEVADFNHVYHTTLVAILAGSVRMYRSRQARSAPAVVADDDGILVQ